MVIDRIDGDKCKLTVTVTSSVAEFIRVQAARTGKTQGLLLSEIVDQYRLRFEEDKDGQNIQ